MLAGCPVPTLCPLSYIWNQALDPLHHLRCTGPDLLPLVHCFLPGGAPPLWQSTLHDIHTSHLLGQQIQCGIAVITCIALVQTVRYALATLISDFLCTLSTVCWYISSPIPIPYWSSV
ncbi:unnamed protein product [Callosobruchus maculatus]|uniref:Uncharacterized protein n=1 Tax=Callosobruchus maculatus TaxID=64391 RepID=A0A653DT53_CALMS|nr:unnamed protein product [Callosobruchus maculatus]